jgi:hypothetical protein
MIKSSVGVSAAPTPTNTGSLKNESKGKESVGHMTPVAGSVWSHSTADKSSDDSQSAQDTKASSSLSKPAPWAKSSQAEGEVAEQPAEVLSTRESIKTSSWAVDSDDEDEEGVVSAPPPSYANPAALGQGGVTSGVSSAAPRAEVQTTSVPASSQQQQYAYTGGGGPQWGNSGSSGAPPGGYGTRQWQGQQGHESARPRGDSYEARGPRFAPSQDGPQGGYRQGGGYPPDSRFGPSSGGNRFPEPVRKPTSDWSSRTNDRPGMPALKPMVHSSSQLAAHGSQLAHGSMSSSSHHGQSSSFSTEGMTEEQRALEEARLEREQLEQRKRQEEQAKRDAEERELRAKEAARMQEERERERARIERERNLAAYDAQQRRAPPPTSYAPLQAGGFSDDGDRWKRVAPPALPPALAQTPGPRNMAPSPRGGPQGYAPHGQAMHLHPSQIQNRPGQHPPRPYGGVPHQQGPAGMSPRQFQQPYGDHRHDEGAANKQPNPTRILQHTQQHKMLFDPKSGGMVEPGTRDRGMSESSTGSNSDKKDSTWRKTVPYSAGPSAAESAAAAAADDARRKERERKMQEMRAAEQEEQRAKEERQNAMREARAKEAAEREPRTQGVLYRYSTKGDLERVLTEAEKAEAALREESRRLEKELARERNAEREKKKAALASKRASREEKLTAEALQAHSGEAADGGTGGTAQLDMDEYVFDEHLLDHLDINSDDILQESIEFVEVKSRRSIAQDKKEKEVTAPTSGPATATGARISPAAVGRGDVRAPRQAKSRSTRDGKDDSSPETTGAAEIPPSLPSTLPPPAKPAWQTAGSTLVDIGVITESERLAAEASARRDAEAAHSAAAEEGRGGKGGRDRERQDKSRAKTDKAKEARVDKDKDKGRREVPPAAGTKKPVKERDSRPTRKKGAEGEEEARGTGRPSSAHAHVSFDTSAVTKHLLGKDVVKASATQRSKDDSSATSEGGAAYPHFMESAQQQPDEHTDNYLDLSGLGLESKPPADILQAFRNDRPQSQW